MKKWQVLTATAMALVMTASLPLAAFAQRADEATAAKPPLKGSLAVVAPRQIPVGKEMSLGVFQRENQEPVPGAGVWALTRENAEGLKNDSALKNKIASAEDVDYEAELGSRGTFLGRTGGDGRIHHTFAQAGTFVLVAAKKSYVPDFYPIVVRTLPIDALVISAPRTSPPGESVTMTVTEKAGGDRIKDAGVWALTRENAEAVKNQIASIRSTENASIGAEAILNAHGVFLGQTNGNGEIKHTFNEEGTFVLAAFKKEYAPGFTVITVKDVPEALAVQSPKVSPVEETVTIKVTRRGTGDPVKDAAVWALTPAEAEGLKAKIASNATPNTDIAPAIQGLGIFIGQTNGNGEVKYKFETAGRYIIVAVEKGYIPGYTQIAIASPSTNATAKPNDGRSNNTTIGLN